MKRGNNLRLQSLPLILATCGLSIGIIISDTFPSNISWIVLTAILLAAVFTYKRKIFLFSLLIFIGGLLCFSNKILPNNHIGRLDAKDIEIVEGTICSDIEKHKNSYVFYLKCDRVFTESIHKCTGKIIVYLKCEPEIKRGDKIRLKGKFYAPSNFTENSKFNYEKYLSRKNIYTIYSLKNTNNITVLENRKNPYLIDTLKNYIIKVFSRNLSEDTGKLLMGMVLGNGNYLDSNTYNNFINTSTLHLLAASGLNCFVLAVFMWYFLFFVEFRKKNILITIILWIYAALIGFSGSILRATLMCSLIILGKSFKISSSFKIVYFLSALLLLFVNPSNLFDVGFQLSYLCLFAMIYIAGPTCKVLFEFIHSIRIKNKVFRYIFRILFTSLLGTITTTLSVYLTVGLISIYYFEYISLIGVFANLLVGFLASLIFVLSMVFLIIWPIPFIKEGGVFLLNLIGKTILFIVNGLGETHSVIKVKSPNEYLVILAYVLIFIFFVFIYPTILQKYTSKNTQKIDWEDEIFKNLPDR